MTHYPSTKPSICSPKLAKLANVKLCKHSCVSGAKNKTENDGEKVKLSRFFVCLQRLATSGIYNFCKPHTIFYQEQQSQSIRKRREKIDEASAAAWISYSTTNDDGICGGFGGEEEGGSSCGMLRRFRLFCAAQVHSLYSYCTQKHTSMNASHSHVCVSVVDVTVSKRYTVYP